MHIEHLKSEPGFFRNINGFKNFKHLTLLILMITCMKKETNPDYEIFNYFKYKNVDQRRMRVGLTVTSKEGYLFVFQFMTFNLF